MMNIKNLIWGLEELSDKEIQEKLWTGKVDGEMSSFVEAISSTFDDSGLGRLIDSKKLTEKISPEIRKRAIELDRLIRQVPQSAAPIEIIQHPVMNDVRTAAKELLSLVKLDNEVE